MKITDMLNEDLGNLAQLKVGKMIDILKQPSHTRRGSSHISGVGTKFYNSPISTTSEIKDVGVLKKGLSSLRKAFKDNEGAEAFAVYIGNHAVMFGLTDAYNLAGSSRDSKIAYDLTPWTDVIDAMYAGQYRKPAAATAKTKEPYYRDEKPRYYAGDMISTGSLAPLFDIMQAVSDQTKQPITAKLVMRDTEAEAKRQKRRLTKNEIEYGTKDLKTRLAVYKNSKKPTANTIDEFIAMSLRKPGSKVQFAGTTYNLTASSYDKIDPVNLLRGATFSTSYSSADPGVYDSLVITYKYDSETNQLLPIKARWTDRRDPNNRYGTQEAVLDPRLYVVDALKTRKLDKDVVLPKLLGMFKSNQHDEVERVMQALESMGLEWPEIAVIRKSITAEKAAKKP